MKRGLLSRVSQHISYGLALLSPTRIDHMPKTKSQTSESADLDPRSGAAASPAAALCCKADALYRAAAECCRQHERIARLVTKSDDDGEEKAAYAVVDHCDQMLAEMAAAYEKAAARAHPNGPDSEWWHKANTLWHASREYARRHSVSDRAARRSCTTRQPDSLATLNMEYELEASALLALRHAIDAYRKVRPHAEC